MAKDKRSKKPDDRPARKRYWASGRLAKRKIRNLMKTGAFESKADAEKYWKSVRKRYVGGDRG